MAKKKHQKKHQFKASHLANPNVSKSTVGANGAVTATAPAASFPAASRANQALAGVDDFSYVTSDLRRIMVLAISFLLLQIVLWYLMSHTSLGASVYKVFHLT